MLSYPNLTKLHELMYKAAYIFGNENHTKLHKLETTRSQMNHFGIYSLCAATWIVIKSVKDLYFKFVK